MGYSVHISPDLHFALCPTRVIFLDLAASRYFCLRIQEDLRFREWVAGGAVDVLTELPSLSKGGYLRETGDASIQHLAQPKSLPDKDLSGWPPLLKRGWTDRVAATVTMASAFWTVRRRGFVGIRDALVGELPKPNEGTSDWREDVQRFQFARASLPFDRQCLIDSLALTFFLRERGHPARLLIGVKDKPFGAHAWVAVGDTVANDLLETVRYFEFICELGA